jgi:DUF1680 family protein
VGDELVIEFPMRPRVVRASDNVDSVRGCVAYERGPLVYCVEGRDVPARGTLEGISVASSRAPAEVPGLDISGHSMVGLALEGKAGTGPTPAQWPYYVTATERARTAGSGGAHPDGGAVGVDLVAVPYFAWANRGGSDMRVWLPEHR